MKPLEAQGKPDQKNGNVSALNLRLEAFTRLSQDDAASLNRLALRTVREVRPRRDLIREGDSPRAVFAAVEGWGCRYKALPDGRRQILAFLIPGDIFDLNIFILKELDHSIGAITTFKVAEIGSDEIEDVMLSHPRLTKALWWDGLAQASIQREWTLNLGQRTAIERVSHLLCEMFLRLEVVGLTDGNSCDFPLTQVDLADATGLTAVHVNRTLQELRKQGLIELQSRTLTIPDLAALQDAGLFNRNYLHLARNGAHMDAND